MLSDFTKERVRSARDRSFKASVTWQTMTRSDDAAGSTRGYTTSITGLKCRFWPLSARELADMGWHSQTERYYLVAFQSLEEMRAVVDPFEPKTNDRIVVAATGKSFIVKGIKPDPLGEAAELLVYVAQSTQEPDA